MLTRSFLLLSLLIQSSFASTFQSYNSSNRQMTLDEVPSRSLKIQQRICVYKKEGLVGCGRVNELYANSAILIMDNDVTPPVRTSYVQLKAMVASEKANIDKTVPSSTEEVTNTYGSASARSVSISAGMNAGLNYYYPSLHLQVAISRSFSLGLSPMYGSYKNDGNEVTGYGGYFTIGYYHTHWVFRGLEFEGGIGIFDITAKNPTIEASTSAVAGKFTVGWRGRGLWDLGLDLGVAGGLQYIHHSQDVIDVSLKDVVPLLSAYIGYSF